MTFINTLYPFVWKLGANHINQPIASIEFLVNLGNFSNLIEACNRENSTWFEKFYVTKVLGSRGRLVSQSVSSVSQSCMTLCDPMNRSTPGLPVHHQLPEFTQTHVHRISDAIQPSHPLSSPSPPAPNPSKHQSLLQWVNSSHEVAKVLEFQL